jgi:hypothetical protein
MGACIKEKAADRDGRHKRQFSFMLEIHRGEMPVERYRNAHRTCFSKKMQTYYEANRRD